jgi:hypothetical protein
MIKRMMCRSMMDLAAMTKSDSSVVVCFQLECPLFQAYWTPVYGPAVARQQPMMSVSVPRLRSPLDLFVMYDGCDDRSCIMTIVFVAEGRDRPATDTLHH